MQLTNAAATHVGAGYISAILNWVCPECGGPMGGRTKEFMCQGRCGKDWRTVWESTFVRLKRKGDRQEQGPSLERVACARSLAGTSPNQWLNARLAVRYRDT